MCGPVIVAVQPHKEIWIELYGFDELCQALQLAEMNEIVITWIYP